VLDGVSLDVSEGEFLVVVGTSGAGKSTLLHVLGLLDSPTKGDVIFKGENLSRLPGRRQAGLRNRLFGFVFQFFHLLPDFNAIENVMMPAVVGCGILKWAGRRREARGRAEELLGRLGLGERLLHRPTQLSGGERQRVAICRALMNKPSVLLLDEPTGNLDTKRGNEILDLIREMNESEGQTVVMVTHDQAASKRASRTVRIRDGRIA
jgi:lipoprotein-releasing system ATP-binding protein